MSEVNKPSLLPIDRLQNVATATEQTVPVIKNQSEQPVAVMKQAAPQTTPAPLVVKTVAETVAPRDARLISETVRTTATVALSTKSTVEQTATPEVTAIPLVLQEHTVRMPELNKQQNVAIRADYKAPPTLAVSSESIQTQQVSVEPVRAILQGTPVPTAAITMVSVPENQAVQQETISAATLELSSEKKPATFETYQPERPTAHPVITAVVTPPESELEILISQPQPIAVREIAAPVAADNRISALVQETPGAKRMFNAGQQIEKVQSVHEQNIVKEMTAPLAGMVSASESSQDSEAAFGNNNQGNPDGSLDDRQMAQDMRGLLIADHQKTPATTKSLSNETLRQDIPEQVMQQVKERLVQHDVKPGNQQITLTFSPDSLGELKMNLNLQGQKLSVEIVTENRTVRDAIIQHTDSLKESLARQNITMESFEVTTGGKGPGGQGQNQNAWRELVKQQHQQQIWASPRGYQTAQADLPSGQAAYQKQQGQSMLDIHY